MDAVIENLNKEDLLDILIRYGLYFGAIFQLICIGACLFLPNNTAGSTDIDENDGNNLDECNNEQQNMTNNSIQKRNHYKNRKQEKKKRR